MSLIPFLQKDQLNNELDHGNTETTALPGNPRIRLNDRPRLTSFIKKEFDLADLERIAPRLWMMSKPDSGNISPLHRQLVKGRKIIITEDIRLHLIWHYERIFIKPLPRYLTSYTFWSQYLTSLNALESQRLPLDSHSHSRTLSSALGFLRTYSHLIRHESDFHIAQELRLIPRDTTWTQLCNFLSGFDGITDADVAMRFSYGEIRLTRLNFYIKIFLRKSHFQRVHTQYGTYFSRFYGPLLFTFGALSVFLSAMQLEMTVEQVYVTRQWARFGDASRGFSIGCIFVVLVLVSVLVFLFFYKLAKEWVYALREHRFKKKYAIEKP